MAYSTKLVVVASVAAALSLEAVLLAVGWSPALPAMAAVFLCTATLGLAVPERAAGPVLFFAYLTPVLVAKLGAPHTFTYPFWMAALFGAVFPTSVRSSWTIPIRWQPALILWAVTIAVTWPVAVLREFDFNPALFAVPSPEPAIGAGPLIATVTICETAAGMGLGVLWFDWLLQMFRRDDARFQKAILVPLAASWAITTGVGIYQLFGNVVFLNETLFGALGRGAGMMLDANSYGVVAAIWGPALIAAASLTSNRTARVLAWVCLVMSWLGLWASAARTAFAAGLIGSVAVGCAIWSESSRLRQLSRRSRIALGAGILGALALMMVLLPLPGGPFVRFRAMLPDWSLQSLVRLAKAMWDRDGYGRVSTHLIAEFPLFGVGPGSFLLLVRDYYFLLLGNSSVPADNAQNWYRQQLAENGIIGSIGWILWVVMFAGVVLRVKPPQPKKMAAIILKGILIGIAVVSLVGIPTQNMAVAITFWTFAFWYASLPGVVDRNDSTTSRIAPRTWIAIWVLVATSVGGTFYTARHYLRVPQRATIGAWPFYYYGLSDKKENAEFEHASESWVGRHAVWVLVPTTRWVKLTLSVDRLNLAKGPVEVKLACDNEPTVTARVRDAQPITGTFEFAKGGVE